MKHRVKLIERPDLTGMTHLTPAELNSLKLSDKLTVLTPEILESKGGTLPAKSRAV